MSSDTYQMPAHGWTCFFCGETFKTPGSARDHFGGDMGATAACRIKAGSERGLLMALRKAEAIIARYQAEDSPMYQILVTQQQRHADALRTAEELGYERGLADGRDEAEIQQVA